ncbi:hypothetical protein GCK32_001336 [Trichostrongylus colubriformis]|uniref:Uncharacterized protein n=1 Tax=Trichostrongylus colubriformis TaxID=6319 RepID=A0AAN8IXA6_TRICO
MCEIAFVKLKENLRDEVQASRPRKQGTVASAASESAVLLKRDGPRGGIITKVAKSFMGLRETLADWATFSTWIVVMPLERDCVATIIEQIIKLARTHFESGGRIATV